MSLTTDEDAYLADMAAQLGLGGGTPQATKYDSSDPYQRAARERFGDVAFLPGAYIPFNPVNEMNPVNAWGRTPLERSTALPGMFDIGRGHSPETLVQFGEGQFGGYHDLAAKQGMLGFFNTPEYRQINEARTAAEEERRALEQRQYDERVAALVRSSWANIGPASQAPAYQNPVTTAPQISQQPRAAAMPVSNNSQAIAGNLRASRAMQFNGLQRPRSQWNAGNQMAPGQNSRRQILAASLRRPVR